MAQVMEQFADGSQGALSDPEAEIRNFVTTRAASLGSLPVTNSLELFYIRGVGNSKHAGGPDRDTVIYGPEFLYVLDVGFPALCGVSLPFFVSGNADPGFPRYREATVVSVPSRTRADVLYPVETGALLVGTTPGTTAEQLAQEVSEHAKDIQPVAPDLFTVSVKPFHEQQSAQQIEQSAPSVRYASLNRIIRIIDFQPGWFVDRIC